MVILTIVTRIINTSMDLNSDGRILTTVTTAEAIIEITTMTIATITEAIVTIVIITTIITTAMINVLILDNIKTGEHKKGRNMLIYSQLVTTIRKIITNSKSMAMIVTKTMGTTSELTWT